MQVDLQYEAPAALATHQRPFGLSNRYSFLPTTTILKALEEDGWGVASATQVRTRNIERRPYAKHQIALVEREILEKGYTAFTEIPRLLLTNSHNGASRYVMQAGLFRVVCSNGMIVSDGLVQAVAIRHSNHTIEECVATANAFRQNAERIAEHVQTFRKTELSAAAVVEFARRAIDIRFRHDPDALVAIEDVIAPKRSQDAGNDLWRTFNRVQEHLLHGGFTVYRRPDDKGDWSERKAKAIRAITENSRVNTELWDLAEQFSLN